jgi:UDP-2,3-diacylglucosamine hydrolase
MTVPVPLTNEPSADFVPSVLVAPNHWREIDFISDLHLQDDEPATFSAWQSFMQNTTADAVFILGDLFEVWVGDDAINSPALRNYDVDERLGIRESTFEQRCVEVLNIASKRLDIFFLHGNRDFLLSQAFEKASGSQCLNDPSCLEFAGERWLLTHGDTLCLDDTDYLAFRAQVRSADWQQNFLAKPLQERQAIARSIRAQSELRKQSGLTYADIDEAEAIRWLTDYQASTLIHGHTHRPADHELINKQLQSQLPTIPLRRMVLSDWDAAATPPRAEILRLGVNHPPIRIKA